jgi:ABC-type branched-subunit amino acid transport system substrate-binding protein
MTNIKLRALITICFFTVFALNACSQQRTPSPWEQRGQETNTITPDATSLTPAQNSFDNAPAVTVALLLPLSGAQANLGQSMLQGAQMALFEMGYTNFNLMPRDTGGTPSGAVNAANSAINDGAQLILGPLFANSVRAVQPIARASNINIIAFSTDWSLANNSTFLMGFMPFTQVERISRFALSKGYKNFALIAGQDKYGDAVTKEFSDIMAQNGGNIVKTINLNNNASETNIKEQITDLKEHNFNAVFIPLNGAQAEKVSSALSESALLPNQVKRIGTGLWDDARIANQPNMNGAWFAAPSPSARREFEQKYSDTFGMPPARLATLAYDATALAANLAQNGFQSGRGPAFDTRSITNSNGYAGTDGVFRFKPNGLIERNLSVLEFRNGNIVEIDRARAGF